jgi:hypothetical protein
MSDATADSVADALEQYLMISFFRPIVYTTNMGDFLVLSVGGSGVSSVSVVSTVWIFSFWEDNER